ncbi:MAG: glycosyltransferase family 39 protein [Anaerolineae bacterium]|nr:glycosyltransferase family 39 protein [Anaerolineae bacterium]
MSLRARLQPLMRWLPLAIILLAGAGLRLDRIGELPPGLYRDEAWYGLDAVGVLNGHLALYFVANNGREGLFIYLLAAAVSVLGQTAFALRVTSALVGIATLCAIYLAGRAFFSHRIGVLAAGVLAGTFWHVALSRVAYRAITLPLFATLGLALAAFAVRATGRRRQVLAIGAGVTLGLTFYTYIRPASGAPGRSRSGRDSAPPSRGSARDRRHGRGDTGNAASPRVLGAAPSRSVSGPGRSSVDPGSRDQQRRSAWRAGFGC